MRSDQSLFSLQPVYTIPQRTATPHAAKKMSNFHCVRWDRETETTGEGLASKIKLSARVRARRWPLVGGNFPVTRERGGVHLFLSPFVATHNADHNGQPLLINLPLTVTSPPILFTAKRPFKQIYASNGPTSHRACTSGEKKNEKSQRAVKNKEQKGQMVIVTHTAHRKKHMSPSCSSYSSLLVLLVLHIWLHQRV